MRVAAGGDVILFRNRRNPTFDMATCVPANERPSAIAFADRLGFAGSLLCAIHCALLPLAMALLPTLGAGAFGADLDQAFVVFATVLGLTTLGVGYRRHRAFGALAWLLPGLVLVWLATFTPLHTHSLGHAALMVVGGLAIAAGHLANLRLGHRAGVAGGATAADEPRA